MPFDDEPKVPKVPPRGTIVWAFDKLPDDDRKREALNRAEADEGKVTRSDNTHAWVRDGYSGSLFRFELRDLVEVDDGFYAENGKAWLVQGG